MDWYAEASLVYYENNHFQFTQGLISAEHWEATRGSILRFLSMNAMSQYWDRHANTYRGSFRVVVDELNREIEQ